MQNVGGSDFMTKNGINFDGEEKLVARLFLTTNLVPEKKLQFFSPIQKYIGWLFLELDQALIETFRALSL